LVQLLAINATLFCLEVIAGILANSTALLADSFDMLADATIYGVETPLAQIRFRWLTEPFVRIFFLFFLY
jgi:Co/Zn/Cd efflux system component